MTSATATSKAIRLADCSSDLERLLTRGDLSPAHHEVSSIKVETSWIPLRDGVKLRADVYLPPLCPAPVVAALTPYGRAVDGHVGTFIAFARRGYAVVAVDCRGTGASEPEHWDYYMYEAEDGYDVIDWISRQEWSAGFIAGCGGSYMGQTQWCMATHPAMSAIAPQVSGLGIAFNTAHLYMFINAYALSVGKGAGTVAIPTHEMERVYEAQTMAGGYFNEPLHEPFSAALLARFSHLRELAPHKAKRWLWEHYTTLPSVQRAELVKQALGVERVTSTDVESLPAIFGHRIPHDAHALPHATPSTLCRSIHAPPLLITGWYDWCLNDALATWEVFRREARSEVAAKARMIIGPHAHSAPGYHEGIDTHPELIRLPTTSNYAALLLCWYAAVRNGNTDTWPRVIYYLMGANEWRVASDWPLPHARVRRFYLAGGGALTIEPPRHASEPDCYTYDPHDPTPTVGGSIVSYVYPPGSVDVSSVQRRADVVVYTTSPLEADLDLVGPLRMILYASSSALDTDFVARLSDVFPDGRAIQIQSGILRARYRNLEGEPELLEPGRIYRFEIDLWATANRFKAGHRLRIDISSADFPHFDRNSNRGGESGESVPARQSLYHDPQHPSHLLVSVLEAD